MKNIAKYLFLIFVIAIVGIAIYKTHIKDEITIDGNDIYYQKTKMITSLRVGIAKYDTINPIISTNREVINLSYILYDSLLTLDKNYELKNNLASEWSKISDVSYIIKLKDNVKWSDGSLFKAQDIKFTVDKIKQYKNSIYYPNVQNINEIEIVDDNTIRIKLNKDSDYFEYNLIFPILNKKQLEKETDFTKVIPIGTGMYKISKEDEKSIKIIKNENWRDLELVNPNIETIEVFKYETVGELYNSFKTGNIDILNTSNTDIQEYIGTMGSNLKEYAGRECDFLSLNCENEVLKYPEVRQAINLGINKEDIALHVLNNKYLKIDYALYPNSYLYDESSTISYNAKNAKKVLEENGWEQRYGRWYKDDKVINLELVVEQDNETRVKVAENIKEQLSEIGIEVYLNKVSKNTYETMIKNKNYDIIYTGIYSSYSPNLQELYGKDNNANYSKDIINDLLLDVRNITDKDMLKQKYKEIYDVIKNENPYVFLYRNKNIMAYSSNLVGEITPNCYTIYYNIETWYRQ